MANEISKCAIKPLIEDNGLNPTKALNNELYLGKQQSGGVRLYYKDNNGVATVLNSGDLYVSDEDFNTFKTKITGDLDNHVKASDPHPQYITDSELSSKLVNVTDTDKWDLFFPVGYIQPFITEIMGDLNVWLAAHPKWAILNNNVVADIEGRVLVPTNATNPSGTRIGQANAILPLHGHAVVDPGHSHDYVTSLARQPQSGSATACWWSDRIERTGVSTTNVTIANSGEDPTNKNYQPTFFLTYIYKKLP